MCVKSKVFDYGQEDASAHEFVLVGLSPPILLVALPFAAACAT